MSVQLPFESYYLGAIPPQIRMNTGFLLTFYTFPEQPMFNGKYVYYMNDCDSSGTTAALYCYKIGSKKPQRITSEASCLSLSFLDYSDGIMYITCSADGKTVFFFKDLEDISDTYDSQGTLMMWSYGDKQPTKVSSEVVAFTLEGIGATGEVKKDGVMFMRFNSVDSNKDIWGNWMYYNGKKTVKIASDVIG